jgi:hypothetical protein
VRVGCPEVSALVRVGEEVIVNIMAWRDDNGCQMGDERNRAPVPHLRGRGDPAPGDFSRSAVARLESGGECDRGGRRVSPGPVRIEGEDQ